jgi:hypothetical protein
MKSAILIPLSKEINSINPLFVIPFVSREISMIGQSRFCENYSARRASEGWMDAARRAGT